MKLIGPFSQILTLANLPLKGSLKDEQLNVIKNGGILINDNSILQVGDYNNLKSQNPDAIIDYINNEQVLLPGFIDSHTHICFGGKRSKDFAMRLNGKTYLEIANSGGGIWSTVLNTREETLNNLIKSTQQRANTLLKKGITTVEVKSGYGLNPDEEIKMLRAINEVKINSNQTIIPTFLGAHMKPKDFNGSNLDYLKLLVNDVFPILKKEKLTNRVDIFVEKSAFNITEADWYLNQAKENGFNITVHADQFTTGGSELAVKYNAQSADHLEFSTSKEINLLAKSNVVSTALPGASIGLGMRYTPTRKLLDAGACVAIASDWNPGSAPMGNLLTQASILATFEKLSMTEVLAGITFRAAHAIGLSKKTGQLKNGFWADFISFPTSDFRDIVYLQGQLQPNIVWKKGEKISI